MTYYILSSVHIFVIMVLSIISLRNTCVILNFMKEKQQTDILNAPSIARLRKILGRYPAVCILYWVFLIPRIIFVCISGKQNILRTTNNKIKNSYLYRLQTLNGLSHLFYPGSFCNMLDTLHWRLHCNFYYEAILYNR